jgi:hypothetical protein
MQKKISIQCKKVYCLRKEGKKVPHLIRSYFWSIWSSATHFAPCTTHVHCNFFSTDVGVAKGDCKSTSIRNKQRCDTWSPIKPDTPQDKTYRHTQSLGLPPSHRYKREGSWDISFAKHHRHLKFDNKSRSHKQIWTTVPHIKVLFKNKIFRIHIGAFSSNALWCY